MYGWIWRRLPGPLWLRSGTALALVIAIVLLLFLVVFPLVEPHLPLTRTGPNG